MRLWIACATTVALLGAGACTEQEQPPVCQSLDAVRTTADHVRDANVSENGLTQLKTDLRELQANLQQLYADAQTEFAIEITAVRTAATNLRTSVDAARATPGAGTFAAVRTSVGGLQASLEQFRTATADTC